MQQVHDAARVMPTLHRKLFWDGITAFLNRVVRQKIRLGLARLLTCLTRGSSNLVPWTVEPSVTLSRHCSKCHKRCLGTQVTQRFTRRNKGLTPPSSERRPTLSLRAALGELRAHCSCATLRITMCLGVVDHVFSSILHVWWSCGAPLCLLYLAPSGGRQAGFSTPGRMLETAEGRQPQMPSIERSAAGVCRMWRAGFMESCAQKLL